MPPERAARAGAALAALFLIGAQVPPPDRCAALASLAVPSVTLESAERVGEVVGPDGIRSPTVPACRVRGIARSTPASRIVFELWLPEGAWSGRYYQFGNGGFAGWIHAPTLAESAARGDAAALSDTGHEGDGFDARWAAGQPEAVVDYGHRSIRATSDAARSLIAAYYGRSAHHRYFMGCSNGGRQALVAAQRYPEDWDGIIAGAPANMWTRQLTSFAALQHRLRVLPGAWLPTTKLAAVQRAALASCPAGTVRDDVALAPERCRFDPATLLCRGIERDDCLTPPQAASLRAIQAAGFEPTSAAVPDNWANWIVNPERAAPSQLTFATQAFRYLLREDQAWRIEDFAPARDRASPALAATIDAETTDFTAFRARGGRILSYFGWADAVIAPRLGLDYYRRVVRAAGGLARARAFYRLFMVPGMTHCQGGVGATAFGQSLSAPALRADSAHDVRAALERWVEQGVAPQSLIATSPPAPGATPAIRRLRPVGG